MNPNSLCFCVVVVFMAALVNGAPMMDDGSTTSSPSGDGIGNVEEICPTACTMEYMPVCDSKGVTHGNKCTFEVAACEARKKYENLFIAKQGTCSGDLTSVLNAESLPPGGRSARFNLLNIDIGCTINCARFHACRVRCLFGIRCQCTAPAGCNCDRFAWEG